MSWRGAAALAIALAALGCSDPESVNPLDAGSTGSAGDAGPPPDAGPFVRSVTMRSPYGAAPKNLFADGDFEWSVASSAGSQFGWLTFDAAGAGEIVSRIETGGICKSGLRCAVLDSASVMLIRGAAAPQNHAMNVSIAVKPPKDTSCTAVRAIALPCDTLGAPQYNIPAPLTAGSDGYCNHSAVIPGSISSICLYVDAGTLPEKSIALVDDAALLDTGSADVAAAAVIFHPEPALEQRLARMRERIRGQMPVGRPPRRMHLAAP